MNFVSVQKRMYIINAAYFDWFRRASLVVKLSMSIGLAALTGVAAQLRIPLPFTPVPITAQVFTVLLAGIVLGSRYGGMSMLFYLLLGFAGVPWFTNAAAGSLIGPTTGYIIGFVPAAMFLGHIVMKYRSARRLVPLTGCMIAAVGIIYVCGALNFALFLGASFKQTLIMAVFPFIPFDIAKAVIAALCARALLLHNPSPID
ncbi:biotin transporter BioY [candidate division WOR-3 bacterium]|nr:biotin transporter BioY [candidate division WOR-3 bacterium]